MNNKYILEYLKLEKDNLLRLVGDNKNEFNQGRIYAMDKMIEGVEGIFFYSEDASYNTDNATPSGDE